MNCESTENDMDYAESEIVRDVTYVPMSDGTRIAYVSYHPKIGQHPTIFSFSPYDGSAFPFEKANPFLDAGYAFLGANWPGTGCSEGIVDSWFPDRKAVRTLINQPSRREGKFVAGGFQTHNLKGAI